MNVSHNQAAEQKTKTSTNLASDPYPEHALQPQGQEKAEEGISYR